MRNTTTVLANLLSHLDRSEFENAVEVYSGDKYVKKLRSYDMFKTMIYGQITSSFSIREIESSLTANSSKLYHAGLKPVKRSTLCDALEKRDHRIFENVFNTLVDKARIISGNQGRRFKNPLKIIDASTIDLCLAKFDWAKFRTTKGAVKIHLKIDGDHLYPEEVKLTTGAVHEVNEMGNLCKNSGNIYVMDRGYVDYKKLYAIDLGNSFFVTRMKRNCQHVEIKCLHTSDIDSIRYDGLIMLSSQKGNKDYPESMRKICYHDSEFDRDYIFITNNFEMTPQEIAEIYKARWQVELFFKWIKQNLKIKTFWGTSKNAVFIQIWTALIVSLLLWIHKNIEKIDASAQRIIQAMKTTILSRKTISELFEPPKLPDKAHSLQLCFKGITY
ncbi:MAG: IS4 family transposase [Clostridiales bacterium]|nr:IS4 family transposase [Clostridiales bacterium]